MLKSLPSSLCGLKSLEIFILAGCSKIEEFPENYGNLEMLKELNADGTALRVLPSSFPLLRNLEISSFLGCNGPPPSSSWSLPRSSPPSTSWSLLRSSSSTSFILHHLPGGNNFVTLPSNISRLTNLESLGLEKCRRLQVLPELPSSIYSLIAQDCTSLRSASNQVLKSLLPTAKLPTKTFKRNSGSHLIYVMIYGSRIPDWIRVSYSLCYSTSSYITDFITISADKEGVGLDHMWLLYVALPLYNNWHNGTRINWHEVTHIRVSFGTHPIRWYAPINRCGFDLVYGNEDVNHDNPKGSNST
ncbi:hypothetical protein AAG906_013770 [Vitis piasezkii]